MYKKDDVLIGCIAAIFFLILGLSVGFIWLYIITKLIVWVSMGLFSYDLTDKFWYVFASIVIVHTIFGLNINVRK